MMMIEEASKKLPCLWTFIYGFYLIVVIGGELLCVYIDWYEVGWSGGWRRYRFFYVDIIIYIWECDWMMEEGRVWAI